jgi:pimeloyl-ACP methyl ester carboxylesterase
MSVSPSKKLIDWKKRRVYHRLGLQLYKVFSLSLSYPKANTEENLMLLYGFPKSSYYFHTVLEALLGHFKRLVLFDFVGFVWSDKPNKKISYSLIEQTDMALSLWTKLGVSGGHLITYDMGNSVTTELAARQVQGQFPAAFNEGILSYTFSNGSVVLESARLRITQKLLESGRGSALKSISSYPLFRHQIISAHWNSNLAEEEIQMLWEGNCLQEGNRKNHLIIEDYIKNHRRFKKQRWLSVLKKLVVPINLCWGTDDTVTRVQFPKYLKENSCPKAQLSIVKNVRHFCQLEHPALWLKIILQFYNLA